MLGNNPGFWVRNGILMLALIVGGVLAMSWIIEYPDIVSAPVSLSSKQPPIRVLAPGAGKLLELRVQDKDSVAQHQVLAVLESGASIEAVQAVESMIGQLQAMQYLTDIGKLNIPEKTNLGPLQATWSALLNDLQTLRIRLSEDIVFQQIKSIQDEIQETEHLIGSLQRQSAILQEDFAIATKNLERQRQMNQQGLLSAQDLEKTESAYLQQKQTLEGFSSNIGTQKVRIRQLETRRSELSHGRLQELNTYWERIREKTQNMRGALDQWALSYLIKAPISGRISFAAPLVSQQFVQREQVLFAIVPGRSETTPENIAYAKLPLANAGKVAPGQAVKIWLDAYPFQEYGALEGSVSTIAEVPAESYYLIEIRLPDTLRTTSKFVLPPKPELSGSARIITKNYNVLQRIFQKFEQLKRS